MSDLILAVVGGVLFVFLLAAIIADIAFRLARADAATVPAAVVCAAKAFVAAVTLSAVVVGALAAVLAVCLHR